jgi:peptide/nickel transport system ATP-binding protein
MSGQKRVILKIRGLSKTYSSGLSLRRGAPAVADVDLDLRQGGFISIIGESGSGKTTLGKLILRLLKPSRGTIEYEGRDLRGIRGRDLKAYYRDVQGIFQDPFCTFNPLYKIDRVFSMIKENFLPDMDTAAFGKKVEEVIGLVDLNPAEVLGKYPHQLSGGQLQRLLIARALVMDVKILVADEIISMLDASTRVDILNLLGKLTYECGMAVLFITHDLSLGYYISEETMIMYKGRVVEFGDSQAVFKSPAHPYTRMLFASVPDITSMHAGKGGSGPSRAEDKENFLPETIDRHVREFYASHPEAERGLVEIGPGPRVVLRI